MSKFIVAVMPEESKAYEGVRALKELHEEGSLSLYGFAVVAKDKGGLLTVKDAADSGPLGAAVGAIVGGFVGLLGGPLGAVVGVASGALIGSFGRLFNLGLGSEFVEKTAAELVPGTIAIVAEIDESWESPLDTRMKALNATVLRNWRADIEDEKLSADIARRRAEFETLKTEFGSATQSAKAILKSRVDQAKAELGEAEKRAKIRMDTLDKELKAKVATLEKQFAGTKLAVKEKLEQRIAALRTSYELRSSKLKQAWELTKEGLAA